MTTLSTLDTPAALIDPNKMQANITRMQQHAIVHSISKTKSARSAPFAKTPCAACATSLFSYFL